MLGRPGTRLPVFMKMCAGPWLIWSVCMDRMIQIESATFAVYGKRVQMSCPESPYFLKSN